VGGLGHLAELAEICPAADANLTGGIAMPVIILRRLSAICFMRKQLADLIG